MSIECCEINKELFIFQENCINTYTLELHKIKAVLIVFGTAYPIGCTGVWRLWTTLAELKSGCIISCFPVIVTNYHSFCSFSIKTLPKNMSTVNDNYF